MREFLLSRPTITRQSRRITAVLVLFGLGIADAQFGSSGQVGGALGGLGRGMQGLGRGRQGEGEERGGLLGGGEGAAIGSALQGANPEQTGDMGGNIEIIGGEQGGSAQITAAGTGKFEPYKDRDLEYGEVPATTEEVTFTLAGPMTVSQFLDLLSTQTGWNVLPTQEVQNISLAFWMNEMTVAQAMEILRFHDIYYEYKPETNFLYVMKKDEYFEREFTDLQEQSFVVSYADFGDVQSVFQSFMSPTGSTISDARTSKIVVRDTKDNLEYMRRALAELDVPIQSKTYVLKYVEAGKIAETIETLISERGQIKMDNRTNSLIVRDSPTKQIEIEETLREIDVPLETRTWILNYADPETLSEQLVSYIPEGMGLVATDESLHQVTVTSIPARLEMVDQVIRDWDKPRRQVQIETYMLTVSRNVVRDLGIKWSYFGFSGDDNPFALRIGNAIQDFASFPDAGALFGIGQLPHPVPLTDADGEAVEDINGNPILTGFEGNDVSAVVDWLETNGDATVIAHPRVTVQDGEEAMFENTTQVPFAQSATDRSVTDPQTGGFRFQPVSQIDFIDVGTILNVVPRIADAGNISMEVSAEDSSFEIVDVVGSGETNTVPQKTQNKAETVVMVHDQATIVLGGLRTSNMSDNVDKVPVLGDIPFIGRLFRSTGKDHSHRELLVFITPTIIDVYTQPEVARLTEADKEIADKMRYDAKGAFGRAVSLAARDKNEIVVAIGQTGALFADGDAITLIDLRQLFTDAKSPVAAEVVIRKHPRAPKDVVEQVETFAREAELKVTYDDSIAPFVPAARPDEQPPTPEKKNPKSVNKK